MKVSSLSGSCKTTHAVLSREKLNVLQYGNSPVTLVATIPSGFSAPGRGGCKPRQWKYASDSGLRIRTSRLEDCRPKSIRHYGPTLGGGAIVQLILIRWWIPRDSQIRAEEQFKWVELWCKAICSIAEPITVVLVTRMGRSLKDIRLYNVNSGVR
jgi:hypothetical protein